MGRVKHNTTGNGTQKQRAKARRQRMEELASLQTFHRAMGELKRERHASSENLGTKAWEGLKQFIKGGI